MVDGYFLSRVRLLSEDFLSRDIGWTGIDGDLHDEWELDTAALVLSRLSLWSLFFLIGNSKLPLTCVGRLLSVVRGNAAVVFVSRLVNVMVFIPTFE